MFEKSSNVCLTTLAIEKLKQENEGSRTCDRFSELHIRLKLTLFKQPLKRVEEEINKSGDKEAADLFDSFNEELQKPEPKKTVLRNLWEGIFRAIPTLSQITEIVANISKLIN